MHRIHSIMKSIAVVVVVSLMWTFSDALQYKLNKHKAPDKATCICDLLMNVGWQNLPLMNIFTREISAWGPGSSPCARMKEGCRILCEIMGRRYVRGRELTSDCQGTKLGQRLCELYSRKNGYAEIKAPGRRVSLSYKLDQCWQKGKSYFHAFNVRGNLCCSSYAPFKELPFLKFMVWKKTCMPNSADTSWRDKMTLY